MIGARESFLAFDVKRKRLKRSASCPRGRSRQFELEFGSREVDLGFAFVAGVVADPKLILVPDKAGVAAIAAGRKFEEFGELAGGRINGGDAHAGAAVVEADTGDETAV